MPQKSRFSKEHDVLFFILFVVLYLLARWFLPNYQWIVLFYGALIYAIYYFRRNIDWQSFAVGLYRTKVGIKLMEKWGKGHRKLVQVLGIIGIYVGFLGMAFIVFMLLKGVWNLFFMPEAPPVVSPVIPGFTIPGTDLRIPLITGWLALFIVIVIHEFSHGVVSKAYDIKVKSSGLLVFGPIGGAFVEPDEKKLAKKSPKVQLSMFAAGPFSNIITAAIFLLVAIFLIAPAASSMMTMSGVEITSVVENLPAANASVAAGMIVTSVNGAPVKTTRDLISKFDDIRPGDVAELGFSGGSVYKLNTIANPDDQDRSYIGVNLQTKTELKQQGFLFRWLNKIVLWLGDLFYWTFLFSFGIGLANLLPLGPVDGGRMLQTGLRKAFGDNKRGDMWWKRISLFVLVIIVVLLAKAIFDGWLLPLFT